MEGDWLIAIGAICSGLGSLFVGLAAIRMAKKEKNEPERAGDGGGSGSGWSFWRPRRNSPDGQQPAGTDDHTDDHDQ